MCVLQCDGNVSVHGRAAVRPVLSALDLKQQKQQLRSKPNRHRTKVMNLEVVVMAMITHGSYQKTSHELVDTFHSIITYKMYVLVSATLEGTSYIVGSMVDH